MACVLTGCSRNVEASDWMLGLFTTIEDVGEEGVWNLAYYEWQEEGSVQVTLLNGCGGRGQLTPHPMLRWERRGRDEVVVLPPEGETEISENSGITTWKVTPGEDCNHIEVRYDRGEQLGPHSRTWTRGKACLELLPGVSELGEHTSDVCLTVWCEGGEPRVCE